MEKIDDTGGHNAMDYIALAGLGSLAVWSALNKEWWIIVALALGTALYTFKQRSKNAG